MVPGSNLLSVRLSRSHHISRFRSFMFISLCAVNKFFCLDLVSLTVKDFRKRHVA